MSEPDAPLHRPSPPPVVRRLRDVMVVGAALTVVAVGLTVVAGLLTLDAEEVAARSALPGTPAPALAGAIVAFAVVVAVIESVLWVLFAGWFARGYAWARITGTVLAAANLAVEVPRMLQPPTALVGALSAAEVAVIAVALVLLWLPVTSRYVTAVSRWREVAAV